MLATILREPEEYGSMREVAQAAATLQSWNRTADRFLALLGDERSSNASPT